MNKTLKISTVIAVMIFALLSVFAVAFAEISFSLPTKTSTFENVPFFTATTTNATSTNLSGGGGYAVIAGAKKVTLWLKRGGVVQPNLGTTQFKIQVSDNPTDTTRWVDFGIFVSPTTTAAQYTGSITLAGTTTVAQSLNLNNQAWQALRVIAVETTDGEHSATASIEY